MKHHRVLRFTSPAAVDDLLLPIRVVGTERLAEPFSYVIDLVARADGPDPDVTALLGQPATLELMQGTGSRHGPSHWCPIRGVVSEFAELAHGHDWIRFRARLVPSIWALSLARKTRVHQNKSIPDIVRSVLTEHEIRGASYEWNLLSRYPVRDYVLQYHEDDLVFVRRLCEDQGIAWYYRHDVDQSILVFTDHPGGWAEVTGDTTIPYRPRHVSDDHESVAAATDWHQQEVVDSFSRHQKVVPKSIVLHDWNYRTPDGNVTAESVVDDQAVGATSNEFGIHRDAVEARRLAGLRAEELRCQQVRYVGASDQRGFRVGHRFSLESHPRATFAMEYVLVAVSHTIEQALDSGSGDQASTQYSNTFEAQPAVKNFRPALTIPRPQVAGALSASIDAAGSGIYPELDEVGRYRVKLHCDTTEAVAGSASRPIRMAQPYGGVDHGLHLPLHKKTEVLLLHVNGDPDRPVIAGVVPNPETKSLVTAENHTQAVLRTAGGNEIRFEDLQGKELVYVLAKRDRSVVVMHDDAKEVGNDQRLIVGRNQKISVAEACQVDIGTDLKTQVGAAMNEIIGGSKTEEVGADKCETVAGARFLEVGKNCSVAVVGEHREVAHEARLITAAKIHLVAEAEFSLHVGKASLVMKADGTIRINGSDVMVLASGAIALKATGSIAIKGAKTMTN